jgi:hypothetical protein
MKEIALDEVKKRLTKELKPQQPQTHIGIRI